jgi:hypothetical protein
MDRLAWCGINSPRPSRTDTDLFGLAVRHKCRLVTFDARLNWYTVIGAGPEHGLTLDLGQRVST